MLSNPFLCTLTCLSNITESRQRRKTFAEQRRGLIRKSLLVALCLSLLTTKRTPAPGGLSELSPSLDSFLVGEKHRGRRNRKNGRTGEGAILKWIRLEWWKGGEKSCRVESGWGDRKRNSNRGFRMRNWEGLLSSHLDKRGHISSKVVLFVRCLRCQLAAYIFTFLLPTINK